MRETPSWAIIDDSECWCGAEATTVLGVYGCGGPVEVPLCDAHRADALRLLGADE